ncbi:MAG: D-alanyl-D-alanine carboxypeptidase family protein [Armatimonadota bacterium]
MEKTLNSRFIKHIQVCLIAVLLCISVTSAIAEPAPPKTGAKAAIIMDAVTGSVLYQKNSHMRRPPASTTKIMTAILALENGKLDDVVTASPKVCETQFSSIHLKPGEQLTLYNLLYGMLLRSGNDAAACTAEYVAGSESKFAALMNKKAKEIGAKNTHFVNPHGLHNPNHYTTAYDLALIARYAIQFPVFNEIVRTKRIRINRTINTADVTMKNTARFLWKFEGADGIKTGHTKEAGRCFVGSATRSNWRLISVVLGSKDAGTDTIELMNYAFKFYKQIIFANTNTVVSTLPLPGGVEETIDIVPAKNLALIVRRSGQAKPRTEIEVRKVRAPIEKGETVGRLTAYLGDKKVGATELVAAKTIKRTLSATIWLWVRSIFLITVIFLAGFIAYGTAVAKAARRRRRSIAKAS